MISAWSELVGKRNLTKVNVFLIAIQYLEEKMWALNKIKQWVKTRFHIRIVKVCKYYLLSFILFPDPRYFVYSAESPALLFQIALTWPRSFWCENILREAEIIVLADNCHISDRAEALARVRSPQRGQTDHITPDWRAASGPCRV